LFETIRVQNNKLRNIDYHNNRVNYSLLKLFGIKKKWDLGDIIKIPELTDNVVYRCKFTYSNEPGQLEFIPYTIRRVKFLYTVECSEFDYSFKFLNRNAFENFKQNISKPEISDIILLKNGWITDTSFSNIVLHDGQKWYTPANPLLKGTKREYYLNQQIIYEDNIHVNDLYKYKIIRLINAMIDLEEAPDIKTENITFKH